MRMSRVGTTKCQVYAEDKKSHGMDQQPRFYNAG